MSNSVKANSRDRRMAQAKAHAAQKEGRANFGSKEQTFAETFEAQKPNFEAIEV